MEQYGKYELVRRIGRGGMAEVFLARSAVAQGLAKTLVIKKIHPAFARSNQFVSMFVDEAKIALGLNHPAIVQVFDFGAVGHSYFLAMEYVEGIDLLRLLHELERRGRRMPAGLAAYIVQQVAKALDYAHRKTDEYGEPLRIVHRDVSPQNVLVSWDGAVKLVDFGIARARHVHEDEGVIKGKFAYMSPEQARGEPVDRRSDIFSAGLVLLELLTGRPVFAGQGKDVLANVRTGAIPDPQELRPDLPRSLRDTILHALAFRPDDRFDTARDLQHALGRFLFRHADDERGPVDSSRLAQFMSGLSIGDRSPRPRRPTARARAESPDEHGLATPAPLADVRERKHVFVVEGRICGLADLERRLGVDAALDTVSEFQRVAAEIAYKHDGHVHARGERGFTFVVGLPVAAEDDPARTIRMALALVDALDAIGCDVEPELRLAVGIQRGVALLQQASSGRFGYELSASTTTLARRLATEAPGASVLVGGGVFRVAQDDWNFEELDTIVLPAEGAPDGAAEPAHRAKVYALRGPKERAQRMRERASRGGRLLGRALELKALHDAYRDVLIARRKRYVVIIGEQGCGKRSLVSAFLDALPDGEALVVRAAARAATSFTPYAMIADLCRDLLGLAEGAEGREVRRRLELVATSLYPGEEDSRHIRALVHAVGMLLGARFEPGEMAETIDPAERRQLIRDALVHVEQALSPSRPLVVVGEDIHWSDDQSHDLFLELMRLPGRRPILGIVTGRPEPRVLESVSDVEADIITLEELAPAAAAELVRRRFAADEDVSDLVAAITARAGGNPFFINEMLDALGERAIVVADPAAGGALRWLRRDAPLQVPTRVEAVVATRIDLLPPALKDTLMRAAVLGRAFTAAQLETLAEQPVLGRVDELVARGLLERRGNGLAFRNDMTMTVAYRLLPEADRAALHAAAAARLEAAAGYRPGRDDAVLARHLELAGDAPVAARRYIRAAEHAIGVGGVHDALRQLGRALKLLPETERAARFEARRLREEILRSLARRPEQLREIDRMRRDAEAIDDPGRIALARARLVQLYLDVGKLSAAERELGAALDAARRTHDPRAESEVLRLSASLARSRGRADEALELCERALALLGTQRDGMAQRAAALNMRGTVLWNVGQLHAAIDSFAEALVIYRMLGHRRPEARVLNNMGIVFAELQELEEALAHYKSSLKLDQELGDRSAIPLKLGNIGQTYTDLGDTQRGEQYLVKALKLAEQNDDERTAADAVISLGQVYLHKRQPRRALELFERGHHLATAAGGERYQEIRSLIYIALASIEAGEPAGRALELGESAAALARAVPMPVGEIFALGAQALALCALGRGSEAAARSTRAVELQAASHQPEGSEQILHIHARACAAAGRPEAARAALRQAMDHIEAKAARLRDPELRATYLAAPVPAAVAAELERVEP